MTRRVLVAAAAVIGLAGAAYVVAGDEGEESFCHADALIGPNGESYGRRHPDCQFVDEEGHLVMTFADGRPLCYAVLTGADEGQHGGQVVDCDDPGPGMSARRPGE